MTSLTALIGNLLAALGIVWSRALLGYALFVFVLCVWVPLIIKRHQPAEPKSYAQRRKELNRVMGGK